MDTLIALCRPASSIASPPRMAIILVLFCAAALGLSEIG